MDTKEVLAEIDRRREQWLNGLISTSELWRILLDIVVAQTRIEMKKLEDQVDLLS